MYSLLTRCLIRCPKLAAMVLGAWTGETPAITLYLLVPKVEYPQLWRTHPSVRADALAQGNLASSGVARLPWWPIEEELRPSGSIPTWSPVVRADKRSESARKRCVRTNTVAVPLGATLPRSSRYLWINADMDLVRAGVFSAASLRILLASCAPCHGSSRSWHANVSSFRSPHPQTGIRDVDNTIDAPGTLVMARGRPPAFCWGL